MVMTARDALSRLRRTAKPLDAERLSALLRLAGDRETRIHNPGEFLPDRRPLDRAPLDYPAAVSIADLEEDDDLPAAAQPMFSRCEWILIATVLTGSWIGLWIWWPK